MRADESVLELEFRSGSPEARETRRSRAAGIFEWTALGIFATLLALITCRHEMWRDELQAWLIARDSHSIFQLIHALSYEGHPALWYLLLWIPAHTWANPAGMQIVNFLISVSLAWVIVSALKLPRSLRLLIAFSFFIFYQYGVTARSYALAILLLIAAARCLMGEHRHRKFAILLLVLSMNTHVFAAPIAVALAAWAFYFSGLKGWRGAAHRLCEREFLGALASVALGGMIALATVWPAKDMVGPHPVLPRDFKSSAGMMWLTFLPRLPSPLQRLLQPFHTSVPLALICSAVFLALAAILLRSGLAKIFFLSCTAMEIVVMAVTVGPPAIYQLGFIFASFVIAILFDHYETEAADSRPHWLPKRIASAALLIFLLPQLVCAADAAELDWRRPFSGAKDAAQWLIDHHLGKNPIVLQPPDDTNGIIAYLHRRDAYFPSCRCYRSYEIRNTQRQTSRMATPEELKRVRANSPLPVILITTFNLPPAYMRSLGLVLLHSTPQDAIQYDEIFYIYEQPNP